MSFPKPTFQTTCLHFPSEVADPPLITSGSMDAGTLVWLRGFGGVKVDGKLVWPARVCSADAGGEKVQKAKTKHAP